LVEKLKVLEGCFDNGRPDQWRVLAAAEASGMPSIDENDLAGTPAGFPEFGEPEGTRVGHTM